MKKLLISLLCILSMFCFVGCGEKDMYMQDKDIYAVVELEIPNELVVTKSVEKAEKGYIVKYYYRNASNYNQIQILMYYVRYVDGKLVAERMAYIDFE